MGLGVIWERYGEPDAELGHCKDATEVVKWTGRVVMVGPEPWPIGSVRCLLGPDANNSF